jgi:hypothetical protein
MVGLPTGIVSAPVVYRMTLFAGKISQLLHTAALADMHTSLEHAHMYENTEPGSIEGYTTQV